MPDIDNDILDLVNNLLEKSGFNVVLHSLEECTSRSSDAPLESQINNVDIIINELEHILSNIDLSHITGDKLAIINLVSFLAELALVEDEARSDAVHIQEESTMRSREKAMADDEEHIEVEETQPGTSIEQDEEYDDERIAREIAEMVDRIQGRSRPSTKEDVFRRDDIDIPPGMARSLNNKSDGVMKMLRAETSRGLYESHKRKLQEDKKRLVGTLKYMETDLQRQRNQDSVQTEARRAETLRRQLMNTKHEGRRVQCEMRRLHEMQDMHAQSRMLRRQHRQELMVRKLFEQQLDRQRRIIVDEKRKEKEKLKEEEDARRRVQLAAETYYRDQYRMQMEQLKSERKDRTVAERAQKQALSRLERDLKNQMLSELGKLKEQMLTEEDAAFYQAMDYNGL